MRIITALILLISLSACSSDRTHENYTKYTEGKTLSDWRGEHVIAPSWYGVLLNSIPGFHLGGLIIDTIIVVTTIDDLIYGNGAIIARNVGCEGLVQEDDYDLYFAWASDGRDDVDDAFRTAKEAYDRKEGVGDLTDEMLRHALKVSRGASIAAKTTMSRSVVQKKATEKLAYKIGGKITIKAIANAFIGFIPVVGPSSAGIINYVILNDIDKKSREYYYNKANIMC